MSKSESIPQHLSFQNFVQMFHIGHGMELLSDAEYFLLGLGLTAELRVTSITLTDEHSC